MIPFRNPIGRPLKYTPAELLDEFEKYVNYCQENPLTTRVSNTYPNGSSEQVTEHPQRLSLAGFQLWLGCDDSWWANLDKGKHGEEFLRVKAYIKKYTEASQVDMASTGMLKENIISRLLGIADKQMMDAKVITEQHFAFGDERAEQGK